MSRSAFFALSLCLILAVSTVPSDVVVPPSILVIWNSAQSRRIPPLTCKQCILFDAAKKNRIGSQYDIVILDGHSVPDEHILGLSWIRLSVLLSEAQPSWIVANTCHGAELGVLKQLFTSAKRLKHVIASPQAVPWGTLKMEFSCAAPHASLASCLHHDGSFFHYSPESLEIAESNARRLLEHLNDCKYEVRWSRLIPPYACLDGTQASPTILHIQKSDLRRLCPADPSSLHLWSCDSGSNIDSLSSHSTAE